MTASLSKKLSVPDLYQITTVCYSQFFIKSVLNEHYSFSLQAKLNSFLLKLLLHKP